MQCPICTKTIPEKLIHSHIDDCLTKQALEEEEIREDHGNNFDDVEADEFAMKMQMNEIYANQEQHQQNFRSERQNNSGSSFMNVICPSTSCNMSMPYSDFPSHWADNHNSQYQGFQCPICALESDQPYHVNEKTNLRGHLQNHHAQFMAHNPSRIRTQQLQTLTEQQQRLTTQHQQDLQTLFGRNPQPQQPIGVNLVSNPNRNPHVQIQPQPQQRQHVRRVSDSGTDDSHSDHSDDDDVARVETKKRPALVSCDVDKFSVGKSCTICLEEFVMGDKLSRMTCLCLYHSHCINKWFTKTPSCPVHIK